MVRNLQKNREIADMEQMGIISKPLVDEEHFWVYTVNLSDDTYVEMGNQKDICNPRSFSELKKNIFSQIDNERNRQEFMRVYCIENLVNEYERGNHSFIREFFMENPQTGREYYAVGIRIYENPVSNVLEAAFWVRDITMAFLQDKINTHLQRKYYMSCFAVNLEKKRVDLLSSELFRQSEGKNVDFDEIRQKTYEETVSYEDKELYLQCSDLNTIAEEVAMFGQYSFHVHHIMRDGKRRLIKHSFQYLIAEDHFLIGFMEDITHDMERDALTGLSNYQGFISSTRYYLKQNPVEGVYAILHFNIKDFKAMNEIVGMEGGNYILQMFGNALQEAAFQPMVVSRETGSNHYSCLIHTKDLDYEEIKRVCREKFVVQKREIYVSIVCGIFPINDLSLPVETMYNRARMMAKQIRDEYIKPYMIYTDNTLDDRKSRAQILSDLDEGMRNGEIQVFYQPIFDAKTEKIVSAEALVRWIKEEGIVSPGKFIPVLEEDGYISKLDLFVAKEVAKTMDQRRYDHEYIVPVAINISRMDFYDDDFWEEVLEYLHREVLEEGLARYEITESAYEMGLMEKEDVLQEIKKLGGIIILDDFGSGISSFSTMIHYDFDILKIDMGFVKKIGVSKKAESAIKAIINMAHDMGVKITAEGAETKEQVDFLKENNCDYIQGFYYAKPMPKEEYLKLLNAQK